MGQTAKLTWPARTHVGAWDDCYDEPCKHKECNSPIGLAIYIYFLYSSNLYVKHAASAIRHYKVFPNACDFYKINPLGD